VGGRSGQVGAGRSREGSRVEISCDDREGLGGSGDGMDGTSKEGSSADCRMNRRQGRTGGRMVSGSNEQCSQCHGKEDQDLPQIEQVVERRHQREKQSRRKTKMMIMDVGVGHQGKGRAPDVDLAV